MKYTKILLLTFLAVALYSCNSKKNEASTDVKPYIPIAEIPLCGQDTTEIMDLVNQCMEIFKSGDKVGATSMFYTVQNGQPVPYTEEEKQNFANHFPFRIFDYKVSSFVIRDELNNEMEVKIQIVPDGDIDKNNGVSKLSFNPVKLNNHWYLTLMNLRAEGVSR